MKWQINSGRPVYVQLIEIIESAIISGLFEPGARLPSVRELAQQAGVNPNTMQRALSELERSGIVYAKRTSGRFITEDEGLIKAMKYEKAADVAVAFLKKMKELGLSAQEVRELITQLEKDGKDDGHTTDK